MWSKIVILLISAVTCQSVEHYDTELYSTPAETPGKMIEEDPSKDLQLRKILEDLYGPKPESLPPPSPALPDRFKEPLAVESIIGQLNTNLINDNELRKNIEDLFGPEPQAPPQPAPLSSPTAYHLNDDTRSFDSVELRRSNFNQVILAHFGHEVGNEPDSKAVLPKESDQDVTTESDDYYRFVDPATFSRKFNNFKEPENSPKEPHKNNPDTAPPPAPIAPLPPSDNHFYFMVPHPTRRHQSPTPTVATTNNTASKEGARAYISTYATAPETTDKAASGSQLISYSRSYMIVSCVAIICMTYIMLP